MEIEIIKGINSALSCPFADAFFKGITTLGNGGAVWIFIAVVLLCFKKTRAAGLSLSISLIFCLLIGNLTLKPIIARPRPFDADLNLVPLIPPPTDFSFPSGHTLSSFAAATSLTLSFKKRGALAFILAALIAFSRLYLMVHYPSDVLFGIILGIFLAYLAKKVFDFISHKC